MSRKPRQKVREKTEEVLNQGLDADVDLNPPLEAGDTGVHEESQQVTAQN